MQRLPQKIAERLKPWFPQDFDLNSVQVKSGGFLGAIFGFFGQSAVTWNQTVNLTPRAKTRFNGEEIVCKEKEWSETEVTAQALWLMGHECCHVAQQREMGWGRFLRAYVREWLRHGGGRSNRLEQPAYELADQIYASFIQDSS